MSKARNWDAQSSSPNLLGGEAIEADNDPSITYDSNPFQNKNIGKRNHF